MNKQSPKQKILKFLLPIGLTVFLFGGAILFFTFSSLNYDEVLKNDSLVVSNLSDKSFTVSVNKEIAKSSGVDGFTVEVNDQKIMACEDNADDLCYTEFVEEQAYIYTEISNVDPKTDYDFSFTKSNIFGLAGSEEVSTLIETDDITENIPQLERIYGKVVDEDSYGLPKSLVIVKNPSGSGVSNLSAISNENGAYSIEYDANSKTGNFLHEIIATTSSGSETSFATASFYTKPVADIVIGDEGEVLSEDLAMTNESKSLIDTVHAANTCVDVSSSGIRAQCSRDTPWVERLDLSTCGFAEGETEINVGLIKYESGVTSFHNPDNVYLALSDMATGEVLKNEANENIWIQNGTKFDLSLANNYEEGKAYEIIAFEGDNPLLNTAGAEPNGEICRNTENSEKPFVVNGNISLVANADEANEIDEESNFAGTGAGPNAVNTGGNINGASDADNLTNVSGQAEVCQKIGENMAIEFPFTGDQINLVQDVNMRYLEGIVTSYDGVYVDGGDSSYVQTVKDVQNYGDYLTPILRICYKGSCDVNNGSEYASRVISAYNQLLNDGALPQNGLWVHAGHNEPNVAEYRPPEEEARFVIDFMNALNSSDVPVSQDPNDAGIKVLSPNFDLYYRGPDDGSIDGGVQNGVEGFPLYPATNYFDAMMAVNGFSDAASGFYAWAVNDYLANRGDNNIITDVQQFAAHIRNSNSSIPNRIFITEMGRINEGIGFSKLGEQIRLLDQEEVVVGMLMFNSMGFNPDPNFAYHSELFGGSQLLRELVSSCSKGTVNIPQEGSVEVSVADLPNTAGNFPVAGSSGVPVGTPAGSNVVPGSTGGIGRGGDPDKVSSTGDRCFSGFCESPEDTSDFIVSDGLVNGYFEGGFEQQGSNNPELKGPDHWKVWYQDKCSGGVCGRFSCGGQDQAPLCRRPEYKEADGDNRIAQGSKSAQYFNTYGTHHAGLYQTIDFGKGGGNRTFTLKAQGSSWSLSDCCNGSKVKDPVPDQCSPAEPCPAINEMWGRVGMDFTGGRDPNSPNIIWGDWSQLPNVQPGDSARFVELSVTGSITDSSLNVFDFENLTVFLASNNRYPYRDNNVYWDSVRLLEDGNEEIGTPLQAAGFDMDNGEVVDLYASLGRYTPADSQGAQVLGAASLAMEPNTEYRITSDEYEFANGTNEMLVANYESRPVTVPLYNDDNGNGIYDRGEPVLRSDKVQIEKVGEIMEIELQEGLNVVSTPLYTEDFSTALSLLNEAQNQGVVTPAIASYKVVGQKTGWNVSVQRGNTSYTDVVDNFEIKPGEPMYLFSENSGSVKIRGAKYQETVSNYLKPGWNFVSIKGIDQQFTAAQVLAEINTVPGIDVNQIVIWDRRNGLFESFVSDGDEQFGNNIIIDSSTEGFFVRVNGSAGYWTPGQVRL